MNDRPSDRYRKLRARAIEGFIAGNSQKSIALRLGVGISAVSRWHSAWVQGKAPPAPVFTPAEDDRLKAMFAEYTRQEIAEALGKTVSSVRHRIRVLGLAKWTPTQKVPREARILHPAPGVTVHRLLG